MNKIYLIYGLVALLVSTEAARVGRVGRLAEDEEFVKPKDAVVESVKKEPVKEESVKVEQVKGELVKEEESPSTTTTTTTTEAPQIPCEGKEKVCVEAKLCVKGFVDGNTLSRNYNYVSGSEKILLAFYFSLLRCSLKN